MRRLYYVLDGKTPVPVRTMLQWAAWFESAERVVGYWQHGGVTVSTVFLGLNHQFGDGPPVLFETMVFGGTFNNQAMRYSTWKDAEIGHMATCKTVRASIEATAEGPQ